MSKVRCKLASKFGDLGYGRIRTLSEVWDEGGMMYVKLATGPSAPWTELEAMERTDRMICFASMGGRDVLEFHTSSRDTGLYRSMSHDELVEAWKKHYMIRNLLRKHMEDIEAFLWAIPNGPMCKRMWKEVSSG